MINWSVLSGLAVNQDMAPRSKGPQRSHLLLLWGSSMLQPPLRWNCCQLSVRWEFRTLQAALEKCPLVCTSMGKSLCPFHANMEKLWFLWMAGLTAFRFEYSAKTASISISHTLLLPGSRDGWLHPRGGKSHSFLSFAILTFRLLLSPVYLYNMLIH